jgi:site-specific DNA-methyltransferase (adenine-specific)
MKFDVIVGNPPYQMSDGGNAASAMPIYNKFVEQAKKLQPRYLTMIIPSRWFSGGRGLDEFRTTMIKDKRIRYLYGFTDSRDCFGSGVEIKGGVCFFLWNRDLEGKCKIVTCNGGIYEYQKPRYLQEDNNNVFIRYEKGVSIFRKVKNELFKNFESIVSPQRPFGLRTYEHGEAEAKKGYVKLYEHGGVGYICRDRIVLNKDWINLPKIFISAAYGAGESYPHQILGKPILADRGSCCTETYVVIGPFENSMIQNNVAAYIKTRFFRFLVMLKKSTQHAPSSVYSFVPMQDFSKPWTDEELYMKYNLTKDEIAFIESMIKPME